MGQFFIKVRRNERDYYFLWSTVVDAPVFGATSLDALRAYVRRKYGEEGEESREQDGSWERLETTGVSIRGYDSPRKAIMDNRAGPNETCLSLEEFADLYCPEVDDNEKEARP